jgi:hypothetical protein
MFPSSNTPTLASSHKTVVDSGVFIRSQAVALRAAAMSAPVSLVTIQQYLKQMQVTRVKMDAAAVMPGLSAYAQTQYGTSIDIVAEYTAMSNALTAVTTYLLANLPTSVALDGTGADAVVTYTVAQLAPLVTKLDALIATLAA